MLTLFTRASVTPTEKVFVTKEQVLDAIVTSDGGRLTDRLADLRVTGPISFTALDDETGIEADVQVSGEYEHDE